jgi:hypothetical protein
MGRVWEIFFIVYVCVCVCVCECVCVCVCECVCVCVFWVLVQYTERPVHRRRHRDAYHYCILAQRLFARTASEPAHDSFDAKCNPLCCCYYYDYYYKPLPPLCVLFSTKCITHTLLFILNLYMGWQKAGLCVEFKLTSVSRLRCFSRHFCSVC